MNWLNGLAFLGGVMMGTAVTVYYFSRHIDRLTAKQKESSNSAAGYRLEMARSADEIKSLRRQNDALRFITAELTRHIDYPLPNDPLPEDDFTTLHQRAGSYSMASSSGPRPVLAGHRKSIESHHSLKTYTRARRAVTP